MEALMFETKGRYYKEDCENFPVKVSLVRDGKQVTIAVYNGWSECLSTTGYVVIAAMKDKLYFKEANSKEGWKFTKAAAQTSQVKRVAISNNDRIIDWVKDGGVGDYELRHDKERNLYYIEKMAFETKYPKRSV